MTRKISSSTWQSVASFATVAEAYITKGMLESHGIPCEITNPVLSNVLPLTESWVPVEVIVPAALAPHARRLLIPDGDPRC